MAQTGPGPLLWEAAEHRSQDWGSFKELKESLSAWRARGLA